MAEETPKTEATNIELQFGLQRIYLKDVSFETPNTPSIFKGKWSPDIHMTLSSKSSTFEQDLFEVVLTVTITAKKEDLTGYLVEVQQAGIFHIAGIKNEELDKMLGAYCPSTLYPFAREAVADLVMKGGFPQILIAPANFEAIYTMRMQKLQEASQQSSQNKTH